MSVVLFKYILSTNSVSNKPNIYIHKLCMTFSYKTIHV